MYYAVTYKGFMNKTLFALCLHELVQLADVQRRGDLPLLIFADRPACLDSAELIVDLFKQNVHLIWFPANTSQVLQPLDGAPYANLKKQGKLDR